MKDTNKQYEAKVIITFPPEAPTNLRVVTDSKGAGATPSAQQATSVPTGKPTGGSVKYVNPDGSDAPPTPEVKANDQLRFSLWWQTAGGTALNPLPNGDLVLIAQYDADPKDKKPRGRRSPFNAGDMALSLEATQPNKWTVNLNLNGAAGQSYFEYSIIAVLDAGATKVFIDPSIIINP
jgi:hypothetical protein